LGRQDRGARLAAIPKDEFNLAVDSDDPPTVTALADRGKATKPGPLI
jgi:hypothetical protein